MFNGPCLPRVSEKRASGFAIPGELLPASFDLRRLAAVVATLPTRDTQDGRLGFRMADIRRGGTLQFQYDGGDDTRRVIVEMVKDPGLVDMMARYFGERRYAAHCQLHIMKPGSSLPEHSHGNDDTFVVFHFERGYDGGRYFERRGGALVYPEIPPFSAYVNRLGVCHGVEEVRSGDRVVLVTSWERSDRKL